MTRKGSGRRFRLRVTAEAEDIKERYTPFAVRIDFGQALKGLGVGGRFDRNSVLVTHAGATEQVVAHRMSEDFCYEDVGDVCWVIEQPDQLSYDVYFDTFEKGSWEPSAKIALVGNGDVLRYNSGVPEPLDVSIPVQMPIFIDWDGDGLTDMILGNAYANTIGWPYHGTWFFRNVGSRKEPVFDDFIRIKADGEFIDSLAFEVVDWDGDGLPDLFAQPYGKSMIHVYRNTGKRDRNGLPVLTKDATLDLEEMIPEGCAIGRMQLIDLYGDGRLQLVAVCRELQDKGPLGHIFGPYYDNYILLFENLTGPGERPEFKEAAKLTLPDGSVLTLKGPSSGAVADWNGDGAWDVVLAETAGSERRLRLFENEGTAREPRLRDAGILGDARYHRVGGHYYHNELFRGFIVLDQSWMFCYLEDVGQKPGRPVLRDRGRLKQLHGRVSVAQYSWPTVCDWDGDGGRDIVAGSAYGVPYLIEEVGHHNPPVYRPRRTLEAAGKIIRHTWGNTVAEWGGERTEGYWQPTVVDWDGDGLPDLLAPVGIRHSEREDGTARPGGRLFFYRNVGTRDEPRFAEPQEILLGDGSRGVVDHIVAPVDWDGDGRIELVAFDNRARLCVFAPRIDPAEDPLTLVRRKVLKMADGRDFTLETVYRFAGRFWGVDHTVCDWRGDGAWDIVAGTRETLLLFENEGTNEDPRYQSGERLKLWGGVIKHSVHSPRPFAVDWDGTGRMDLLIGSESGWFHLLLRPTLVGSRPRARVGPPEVTE